MPNVYLHNRLFDFIHKYKDDLQVEFLKNTKHLPKNYFTDKQTKDKVSLSYRLKKISRKIINTKWWEDKRLPMKVPPWEDTDYNDHLYVIGNWKMKPLYYNKKWIWEKYSDRGTKVDGTTFGTVSAYDLVKKHYPKTVEMLDKIKKDYGDCINKATFSILTAGGHITVHKGLENIHSEYIRCHIPVIIPEHKKDELYLEVNGDKVYWTETFGFDNQAYHTAKNKTPYNRLVFMVDISREALGICEKKKTTMPFFTRLARIILRRGVNLN